MDFLSVIFLLITLLVGGKAGPCLIIQQKSITINGNTSIGGFSCEYEIAGKSDTLFINNLKKTPYRFHIPVAAFQCGNFLLNRDFQTTLNADEYPKATVQLLSLQEINNQTFKGTIELSLVGKTKVLEDVKFCFGSRDDIQVLSADFAFNASEFDLKPPKKLGGLIKADDTMKITVILVMTPLHEKHY